MVSTLHIQLLGGFHLRFDDAPVTTLDQERLQALLAYLVLHRATPHARQHLAFLLWPDSSEAQARTNLRSLLHRLRQALPGADDFLHVDAQVVQWRADAPYTLDVAAIERALAQAHAAEQRGDQPTQRAALAQAVELYQGDLLPGWYGDWVLLERERLHQVFLAALERLVVLLEQSGEYAAAIGYAQRLLRHEPLHEAAYQHLMRLHALSGDRASALRVYQTCVTVLERELGVEPSPATRTAYDRLLHMEAPPVDHPAVLPATRRPHNLPIALTSFIGREAELAELARRLADPACRLLTITGPGGVGKTRLAIQAAANQIARFAHGVFFVPLVAVSAAELIVPAIAAALNFSFSGPVDPITQLLNYLREKQVLLVLDNFEHLLAGSGMLIDILSAAPGVRLLVTSREMLHLQGEWVFQLRGLPVPLAEHASELEAYSAAALFLQSARRAHVDFVLPAGERPVVAHLCQLVEGMPLGLELAAAWARVLSCREIAQEIERNLDFLVASARDVPARHRSMRAVFDHSWNLLSAEEQRVLRQLSVFRGGFTRQAAEQVAGASLQVLAGLVDKSLVSLTPGGRYHMHELLRQFSADKLKAALPEQEATRARHSTYFLAFLHQREAGLTGKQQKAVLDEIQAEVENVRAAWNWAVEQGPVEAFESAMEGLYQFYRLRSHFQEGEEIFRAVAEHLHTLELRSPTRERMLIEKVFMKALTRQGAFCVQVGRFDLARNLLQNSLELARRWEAPAEIAFCLNFLGDAVWRQGDYLAAEHLYRESLAVSQAIDDHLSMAETLERLGWLTSIQKGDYLTAQRYLQQGLDLLRDIENHAGMAFVLEHLGYNAFLLGEYTRSEQYYQESAALFKEIGDRYGMALAVGGLSLVAWGYGGARLNEAKQLMEEALTMFREIGHRYQIEICLAFLGHISNSMGRYEEAQRYLQEAWDEAKRINPTFTMAWFLGGLSEAALGLGDLQAARHYLLEALENKIVPPTFLALVSWAMLLMKEADLPAAGVAAGQEAPPNHEQKQQAVEILSLVLSHPATWQVDKGKADRLLAGLKTELPPEVFAAARARGQAKTVDAVVEEILAAAG
jgi:predicted ATPase/DNA-binding SARP family transcriptional activator